MLCVRFWPFLTIVNVSPFVNVILREQKKVLTLLEMHKYICGLSFTDMAN